MIDIELEVSSDVCKLTIMIVIEALNFEVSAISASSSSIWKVEASSSSSILQVNIGIRYLSCLCPSIFKVCRITPSQAGNIVIS